MATKIQKIENKFTQFTYSMFKISVVLLVCNIIYYIANKAYSTFVFYN